MSTGNPAGEPVPQAPTTTDVVFTPLPSAETCIPPKKFERNEYGLICDGSVSYVYNEDGTINWRKMIRPQFLVPNKQFFEKKGLPVPERSEERRVGKECR